MMKLQPDGWRGVLQRKSGELEGELTSKIVGDTMVNRVLKYGLFAVACTLPVLIQISPARAVSWSERGSDGKVCRYLVTPHFHAGVGADRGSEQAARASAVRRWKSFTTWEYGPGWDNIAFAKYKNFVCADVLSVWKCIFTAQPCRN